MARQGEYRRYPYYIHLVMLRAFFHEFLSHSIEIHRSWMPSATALSSFLCYTLIAGEKLTVSTAFTAVSLFSYLQGPMTELPAQIFALLHGL